MKIAKYGTVTITDGPIQIDGWLVTREAGDPPEATHEQLLLATVIAWARKKFNDEANKVVIEAVAQKNVH